MNYWLIKTEPDAFSIDDLKKAKVEPWDGIRNYQARNFMRDDMKIGDKVLVYHSVTKPPHVAGLAEVASKPYPDPTQFDARSKYYDEKSSKDNPRWILVDMKFISKAKQTLPLGDIKDDPKLEGIMLAQKGARLSIMPLSKKHYDYIAKKIMK